MLNFENHWPRPSPARSVAICQGDYEWGTGNLGGIIGYCIVIIIVLGTPNPIVAYQSEGGFVEVE